MATMFFLALRVRLVLFAESDISYRWGGELLFGGGGVVAVAAVGVAVVVGVAALAG